MKMHSFLNYLLQVGCFWVAAGIAAAEPQVEILPVAVWQGRLQSLPVDSLLDDIRRAVPDQRLVHAVSAAPFLRDASGAEVFRAQLLAILRPGDDIVLHMAPWKSIASKAGVTFQTSSPLFGGKLSQADCTVDCGLDLSFKAYSFMDIKKMIEVSQTAVRSNGLGRPEAVYFEEGVTSPTIHEAASRLGELKDWSGIALSQLKASFGRFPIYEWNQTYADRLPLEDFKQQQVNGLELDHPRFSIHAEIADMASSRDLIQSAIDLAIEHGRTVRIPIVFNVSDLYYTHAFVTEAIDVMQGMVQAANLKVSTPEPLNGRWDLPMSVVQAEMQEPAKVAPASDGVIASDDQPEFIPQEELELDRFVEIQALAH